MTTTSSILSTLTTPYMFHPPRDHQYGMGSGQVFFSSTFNLHTHGKTKFKCISKVYKSEHPQKFIGAAI